MPAQIPTEEAEKAFAAIKDLEGFLPPAASRYLTVKAIQYLSPDAMSSYGLTYLRTKAKTDGEFGLLPKEIADEIVQNLRREKVPFKEVNAWEGKLKHDVRGLVRASYNALGHKARSFVYIPCTSYDVINSAYSMALSDFTDEAIIPEALKFTKNMLKKAGENKETVMIGRTHKQHAEATTAGHFFCEMLRGVVPPMIDVIASANHLKIKNSGFVGNKAGRVLLAKARGVDVDMDEYDKRFSHLIGLDLDKVTGQVVHQYYYTDYFSRLTSLCGGIANFTENIRNYQQTEVGEITEQTLEGQVGSSTGAHKRNPITCENIAGGQWRHLRAEYMTTLDDLITDFQRDLRDSSNKRYYLYGIGNTALYMISKGADVAEKLTVRKEKMSENLGLTRGLICAEPLQMYLQDWVGRNSELFVDTHEHVRVLTNKTIEILSDKEIPEEEKPTFQEVAEQDELVQKALKDASPEVTEMIFDPKKYIGTSVKDVENYIQECETVISTVEKLLKEHEKFAYV